jgi:hypothetical protein
MHVYKLPLYIALLGALVMTVAVSAEERQVTSTPKNHHLDNNDNFSPDLKYLVYDTREMHGPGIDNSRTIEMVEIATGKETVLYEPPFKREGDKAVPGVAAVSFHPIENSVVFIHGPLVKDLAARGWYGKPNRNGASVVADGSGTMTWADHRDIDTSRPTLPGAHRGGTHRHEYSFDGKRIGFTYDDFLVTEFDRTIGMELPHPDAPGGASHYFCLLVRPVPKGTSKPGEIEKAYGDSWIGREGHSRGFIGVVRNEDGETYEESLFVVDIPKDIDITTAKAGSGTEYPTPPEGLRIRRLTHSFAKGILRGTLEADRIAYYALDSNGILQVFIIASDGSDRSSDPAKRPVQATRFDQDAGEGVRWHPSGNYIATVANNGVAATCVKPGADFGKTKWLTPQGDSPLRYALVWSPDGKTLAYNKDVPTTGPDGTIVKTYAGGDCAQIFMVDFEEF